MQYIKGSLMQVLNSNVFNPVIYGLYGYIIFLAILITIKGITSLISSFPFNHIVPNDLLFSSTGFIIFFLIKMLESHIKVKIKSCN